MEENTRTIEINGVKFEIDLRHAKRVDTYRIGDRVKILVKEYGSYTPYPGIVVGFDNFTALPTIIVAYVKAKGYEASIELAYINNAEETKNSFELCPDLNDINIEIDRGEVVAKFNREIEKKQVEILDLERKKEYFITKFGEFFKAE